MLDIIMMTWRKRIKYPELIGLIVAATATRLWNLFTPNAIVFDEVYFKAFAGHYLDGRYFFDIHPPLAKLIFAGWAKILGISADTLLNHAPLLLRIIPALAGIAIIPLFWGILRRLGVSRKFAFIGALALVFENALVVESRFILMDSLLLMFGLAAIYLYLTYQQTRSNWRWLWIILAAICAGSTMSIKWTGLTILALLGVLWVGDFINNWREWRKRLIELGILVVIPFLIYAGSFWLHFALLPKSGDGDAFMSNTFQSQLIGNPNYNQNTHTSIASRFVELNIEMFRANQTLTATHPYSSQWFTWPLETRPIYYWQGDTLSNGKQGNIYLLGNPVVWWGVVFGAIIGIFTLIIARIKLSKKAQLSLSFLLIAYLFNFMPFMAVSRVMFLYHYFLAFIFSLAAVCVLWDSISDSLVAEGAISRKSLWRVLGVLMSIIILSFIYFSPLTYGTPMSPADLQAHMWLKSWR